MAYLLDTSIAVELREGNLDVVGSFTLITLNKADFADIEGLDILDWGS